VLIAGGVSQSGTCAACATATAEIFNPSTRTFRYTGSMLAARTGHTATLLANGSVLIAGGQAESGAILTETELYNPATGVFTRAGEMNLPRVKHGAALLASGNVLLAGGFSRPSTITSSAELFDPVSGKFTLAASMLDARAAYSMVRFSMAGTDAHPHESRLPLRLPRDSGSPVPRR
jgi:hypothetical protein